jgi:antitoxin ParD1/3/4
MNISLPQALEEFVREQVDSGMYDSHSEVHREALRLLMLNRGQDSKLNELRAAIDIGIEQANRGEAKTCTLQDIVQLSKERSRVQGGR